MNYIVSIGLEIHIALNVDKKAFSPERVNDSSWVSLGFPGTLPILNLEAVKKTIILAKALNANVNYENISFDRKNYFYYDLPRGYQITQFFNPIGQRGFLSVGGRKITLKQIHMEEDTAQQFKHGHEVRLSFSRLGRALAEVVTNPDFRSYEEIEIFLRQLRRICNFLNISSASYEEGKMRIDLNVSLRRNNEDPLSVKSEVKNLNSLFSLKNALEYLIKLQSEALDRGEEVEGYTYAWVEKLKKCEIMRKKNTTREYFYIPEANIPTLRFTKSEYEGMVNEIFWNLEFLKEELVQGGLKDSESDYLLDNYEIFKCVNRLNEKLQNLRSSYNWIVNIASGFLVSGEELPYDDVEKVVVQTEIKKDINLRMAKDLLKEIIVNKASYKNAIRKLKPVELSDDETIGALVESAFLIYQDQLPKLIENPSKLERLIIGECMKKSKGQANPLKTKQFFEKILERYKI
ncbi:aspartyl/glutamyl-tRNA(Asn/Gln) amidotransferase, B subunit [Mycoplasma haemocanis str. Illinois]|uniref:Aspartyl/glutamyl-tRNA(Asn/Gln) amidotransferase subunit B n=1 Tax=Mycoplasma haemocanis (strain Illinois) TaxID=1111676 RepID=H6N8J1_MYCHN|nr:Asp-tRNA(Asn)/Glu-tRNA(Gln) amidotransferase subunit GatB [Mycoplasma haemocanis]AEW45963.1 aspartyl/glutamyl-tRNA(Asn/Gln) amidotransferase, B subunit [Mycoplasma haemocanis str. Illinois]